MCVCVCVCVCMWVGQVYSLEIIPTDFQQQQPTPFAQTAKF